MNKIKLAECEAWLQGIEQHKDVVNEAVKINKDYPELTLSEVMYIAKEVIKYEEDYKKNRIRSSHKEESLSKYCR